MFVVVIVAKVKYFPDCLSNESEAINKCLIAGLKTGLITVIIPGNHLCYFNLVKGTISSWPTEHEII